MNSSFGQRVWNIAQKDLRIAGRTRDTLMSTLFFAGLVLLVQGLALGSQDTRSELQNAAMASGVIWTALALAAAVSAGRAFSLEQEAGAIEQLGLYPGAQGAIYLGKMLAVLLPLLLVSLVIFPLGIILFGATGYQDQLLSLTLTLVLGLLGFSAATTFYGAMTVHLRAREALLPALAFPILVPVVLACVKSTTLLLQEGWSADVTSWLGFLAAFDLATIILATILFPFTLEN